MEISRSSYVLHNLTHIILPFAISSIFLLIDTTLDAYDILIIAILGGFSPDIDHINIWLEYKFESFRSFLRFVTTVRSYRYSFLIFHNLGTVIAIALLIPIIGNLSLLAAVFLTAFLAHLMLDFFTDKMSIGRVTHWRYRRRT